MPTKIVDISDMQIVLDYLVSLLEPDMEIILTEGDNALVKLIPIESIISSNIDRIPDLYPAMWISDDFDDLLPGEYFLAGQT